MNDLIQNDPAALKEELKALKASLKEAKSNHKKAVAYNKALGDDAEEKPSAVDAENGWSAEVARLEAEVSAKDEAVKEAAAAKKAAAAEAKAAAKEPREPAVKQNGQAQPREGSISAKLWAIFDAAAQRLGRVPAIGDVLDEAVSAGIVPGSVRAGYNHWRKFHGISGRVKSEEQLQKEAAAAEAKAEKERAAAEAKAAKAAAEPDASED